MEKTIPELMSSIPKYFVPEKAAGVDTVVHFHLTGENGGDWAVTIKNSECRVAEVVPADPTLVFTADAQDCLDILTDKLDGMRAYMSGKLKLKGDMRVAMKIAGFFKINQ
jgi:putative sterol carrier protein